MQDYGASVSAGDRNFMLREFDSAMSVRLQENGSVERMRAPLTILQRYVLWELLGPFFLGLGVFTFVFLVGQLYRLIDLLMTSSASPLPVAELILALLPGILSITTPMALLVTILLSIGRLAADREIIAIRMNADMEGHRQSDEGLRLPYHACQ